MPSEDAPMKNKQGARSPEMNDLLLRFLRGETDSSEDGRVTAWLDESPDHHAQMEDLRTILSLAQTRDGAAEPGDPPRAADIIFRAGMRAASKRKPMGRRGLTRAFSAVAAVAFIALGFLGHRAVVGSGEGNTLAVEEFSTSAGESATVRMNDGSVVRLGPESRLQVLATHSSRQVMLEGRAFFAVTHDSSRPFRVFTPAGSVRVLGTRFELRADVSDLRLVVVEGTVALAARDAEVMVETGEMTQISRGEAGEVVRAPDLDELSSDWMGQFLVFQDTPLGNAAREIESVYGVEVRILDPVLAGRNLTMWFSSRPIEDVLRVVCSVINSPCRIEGRVVSIGVE